MRVTNICVALSLAFGCVGAAALSIAEETPTDPERGLGMLACRSQTACSSDKVADAGDVTRLESVMDASNTGVPAGTTVAQHHTGTLTITTDDTVVDGWEITGNIVVDAKNVTIKNTRLLSDSFHGVYVMEDSAGFRLMDSEIDGQGKTDNAVLGFGTFLRNEFRGAENGMAIWGPSVVRDNYVHDLERSGKDDPHYDGIAIHGGHDIEIAHNTVINDANGTAALFMQNTFAPLSNIVVDDNLLIGGNYTLYLDGSRSGGAVDSTSIRITNNRLGEGYYGYTAFDATKPVFTGNVELGRVP